MVVVGPGEGLSKGGLTRFVGPSGGWGPRGVGPGRVVVVLTWWEGAQTGGGVRTKLLGAKRVECAGGGWRVLNDCMAIYLLCRALFFVSHSICPTLWLGGGPVQHTLQ